METILKDIIKKEVVVAKLNYTMNFGGTEILVKLGLN